MPALADTLLVFGTQFEFVLFAITLLSVAVFHRRTLAAALSGLLAITLYKVFFADFHGTAGLAGLAKHLQDEAVIVANLALVLTGFAILSRHFEQSKLPDLAPDILPRGWMGGLVLLALVFVFSGVLDNIAAALIGATVAQHVYKGKVSLGFLAAIVAASNAGGAGSVVGDTTTTMMWVAGKNPWDVLHAYIGAATCIAIFAIPAALAQQKHHAIALHPPSTARADYGRIAIVAFILLVTVGANISVNLLAPHVTETFPVIGIAIWLAIVIASAFRQTDWKPLRESAKGTLFLVSLVLCASLMPVGALPSPSWESTFALGFLSSVFDNIPLTALALEQGQYDWGLLAYAVGVGGSLVWFGSSAGVAVSNIFPQAKSVGAWLRASWWLPVAYVAGFLVMLGVTGWNPLP
jgi:Na+/H+ antiporter NhaD/arsenite permease-like protein